MEVAARARSRGGQLLHDVLSRAGRELASGGLHESVVPAARRRADRELSSGRKLRHRGRRDHCRRQIYARPRRMPGLVRHRADAPAQPRSLLRKPDRMASTARLSTSLPAVAIDLLIGAIKAIVVLLLVLNLAAVLLWFERKGSALIQDRIGANRAVIFGSASASGCRTSGLVNTLMADPLKLFTKEDFVPDGRRQIPPRAGAVPRAVPGADHLCGGAVRRRGAHRLAHHRRCRRPTSTPARSTSWRRSGSAFTASRSADGPRTIAGRCSAAFAPPRR